MKKNLEIEEVLAKSLVNYNNSKKISIECKEQDITRFCTHRIISFCNAIEKNDKTDLVVEALEKMKEESPKSMEDIEQSIKDLQVEKHAVLLTTYGQKQCDAKAPDKWEFASEDITQASEDIPSELVIDVRENLAIKQEMKEFKGQAEALSNAILVIDVNRAEDLIVAQDCVAEATE